MIDIKWSAPPEHNDHTRTITYDQDGQIIIVSFFGN